MQPPWLVLLSYIFFDTLWSTIPDKKCVESWVKADFLWKAGFSWKSAFTTWYQSEAPHQALMSTLASVCLGSNWTIFPSSFNQCWSVCLRPSPTRPQGLSLPGNTADCLASNILCKLGPPKLLPFLFDLLCPSFKAHHKWYLPQEAFSSPSKTWDLTFLWTPTWFSFIAASV